MFSKDEYSNFNNDIFAKSVFEISSLKESYIYLNVVITKLMAMKKSAILYKATITIYLNFVLRPLLKFAFSKQTCFDSAVG